MQESTIQYLRIRLRQLRKLHNLTQEHFAELAGVDYKFYQSIEAGRRKELRVSTLERIAKPYGIPAYQLLTPELPQTKLINSVMSEPKTKYFGRRSPKRKSKSG